MAMVWPHHLRMHPQPKETEDLMYHSGREYKRNRIRQFSVSRLARQLRLRLFCYPRQETTQTLRQRKCPRKSYTEGRATKTRHWKHCLQQEGLLLRKSRQGHLLEIRRCCREQTALKSGQFVCRWTNLWFAWRAPARR